MITPEEREALCKIIGYISEVPVEELPMYFTHKHKLIRQAARIKYDIETCKDERLCRALRTLLRLQANYPL